MSEVDRPSLFFIARLQPMEQVLKDISIMLHEIQILKHFAQFLTNLDVNDEPLKSVPKNHFIFIVISKKLWVREFTRGLTQF
jgi:hypothetical protein